MADDRRTRSSLPFDDGLRAAAGVYARRLGFVLLALVVSVTIVGALHLMRLIGTAVAADGGSAPDGLTVLVVLGAVLLGLIVLGRLAVQSFTLSISRGALTGVFVLVLIVVVLIVAPSALLAVL